LTPFKIKNRDALRLWLQAQGLASAPTGPLDVMAVIRQLGFVQLDTIQVVARAHHHILWSRNQNYRETMLDPLMAKHRALFEHFTHDASVLPMEFLPMWQRQFRRKKERIERLGWYSSMPDAEGRAGIKARIAQEGPLSTHAFDTKVDGPKQMWSRPPHKLALDYMWYSGELATSHRENFTKFYDLAERVFPDHLREQQHDDDVQVDWLCRAALDRIGCGALGEIQKFWEATDAKEVRAWAEQATDLIAIEIEDAEGNWCPAVAPADIEERLARVQAPTSRLRILNPFDPVIRDRNRLERLFGFNYRVEMFVPATKRVWGYYVFPLLEGDRFVGRVEAKADRNTGTLRVVNLWNEPGVRWTQARQVKLVGEVQRMARFVGVPEIEWACLAPTIE
jgi:uncharacterized protein YcaQ